MLNKFPNSFLAVIFFSMISTLAGAQEESALWEYGVGFGFAKFEHYPSANQYNNLFLPFPTFQYRGKIVRADDREGTRAFLFKEKMWFIELSGGGYIGLDSSTNDVRNGMPDLPWNIHLGPQFVFNFSDQLDFRLGLFQAFATDFCTTYLAGQVSEAKLLYQWEKSFSSSFYSENLTSSGRLSLGFKGGSNDFLSTYFDIAPKYATSNRSAYESKAGLLNLELTYFHSLKIERTSLYVGMAILDYKNSANKLSPLHKVDYNTSFLVGLTYALSQSSRPSVPEEKTDGLIKKFK